MKTTNLPFWILLAIAGAADSEAAAASQFASASEILGIAVHGLDGLSADGQTVIGRTIRGPTGSPMSGFIWNRYTGLTDLDSGTIPFVVSSNGMRVIAKTIRVSDEEVPSCTEQTIIQWSEGHTTPLFSNDCDPSIFGATDDASRLYGVSSDGASSASVTRFSRTAADYIDTVILADDTDVVSGSLHVSEDGTTIGGFIEFKNAFRWTEQEGVEDLGTIFGYDRSHVETYTGNNSPLSADGTAIAGRAFNSSTLESQAFRWTEAIGMMGLGFLTGHVDSRALSISSDGEIVLGRSAPDETAQSLANSKAFVWDPVHGMRELQSVLAEDFGLGEQTTGVRIPSAARISASRTTLYGATLTGDGGTVAGEPWIALLDRPLVAFQPSEIVGDLTNDRLVDVADVDVLMSAIRDRSHETPYDLDASDQIDSDDLTWLVRGILNTWMGDANLDGRFNASDLLAVFQAGQYEDSIENNSKWSTGDWNADGDFTTSDLVAALQDGGYEQGPRPAAQAIPEPAGCVLLSIGLLVSCRSLRRR